ncbi:hypothetical protein Droror1_Dr00017662 [Drosera rotundifolia]
MLASPISDLRRVAHSRVSFITGGARGSFTLGKNQPRRAVKPPRRAVGFLPSPGIALRGRRRAPCFEETPGSEQRGLRMGMSLSLLVGPGNGPIRIRPGMELFTVPGVSPEARCLAREGTPLPGVADSCPAWRFHCPTWLVFSQCGRSSRAACYEGDAAVSSATEVGDGRGEHGGGCIGEFDGGCDGRRWGTVVASVARGGGG